MIYGGANDAKKGIDDGQTYNQFHRITKGRIHQSPHGLSHDRRQLLGREAQQRREGNDGDEVQREHDGAVPMEGSGDNAQRHEDEQDIDIIAH